MFFNFWNNKDSEEVMKLRISNGRLQSKIERQRKEIIRLQQINDQRKEVISVFAKARDDFRDFVIYASAALDSYGHKDKPSLGFDLRAILSRGPVKELVSK